MTQKEFLDGELFTIPGGNPGNLIYRFILSRHLIMPHSVWCGGEYQFQVAEVTPDKVKCFTEKFGKQIEFEIELIKLKKYEIKTS